MATTFLTAVSGGKDSLSLLHLLRERIKRIPIDYSITAVHVDPGFGADSAARMEEFFRSNDLEIQDTPNRHRGQGSRERQSRESLLSLLPFKKKTTL